MVLSGCGPRPRRAPGDGTAGGYLAPVETYLAVSALGPDRPGLVNELSQAILDCGCRIRDSRMTVLGREFAAVILLSGNWNAVAKLETLLPRLRETLRADIQWRRTEPRREVTNLIPYGVEVVSANQPGVVRDVAEFFSRRDINIEDLHTTTYTAPHTGAPMFSMHMTVGVPADTSIAALRGEFMDFCDDLNLDAMLAPVK